MTSNTTTPLSIGMEAYEIDQVHYHNLFCLLMDLNWHNARIIMQNEKASREAFNLIEGLKWHFENSLFHMPPPPGKEVRNKLCKN